MEYENGQKCNKPFREFVDLEGGVNCTTLVPPNKIWVL